MATTGPQSLVLFEDALVPEMGPLVETRPVFDLVLGAHTLRERIAMQKIPSECEISWFVMVVRLSNEYTREDRDRILAGLQEKGIGCSNYFTPIHLQPFYVKEFGYRPGDFPVCEALSDRTIALPFHGLLTESQVDYVCQTLKSLL